MLPRLRFDLPIDLPIDLPFGSTRAPSVGELPQAFASGSAWTWILAGAALALVGMWAVRRARRMVLAAAVGVTGLVLAWNAGFLPLSA